MSKSTRTAIWIALIANSVYLAYQLDEGPDVFNLLIAVYCLGCLVVLRLGSRIAPP